MMKKAMASQTALPPIKLLMSNDPSIKVLQRNVRQHDANETMV
jgi:hypothetical protein